MKRQVVDCCSCGKPDVKSPVILRLHVGRCFDGVETVSNYEPVDLCPGCAAEELQRLLDGKGVFSGKDVSDKDRERWVEKVRRAKKV